MQGISYQYEKTDTNDKIKVTVTYPQKEDAAQERLLNEVKSMMETIIVQQLNEKP